MPPSSHVSLRGLISAAQGCTEEASRARLGALHGRDPCSVLSGTGPQPEAQSCPLGRLQATTSSLPLQEPSVTSVPLGSPSPTLTIAVKLWEVNGRVQGSDIWWESEGIRIFVSLWGWQILLHLTVLTVWVYSSFLSQTLPKTRPTSSRGMTPSRSPAARDPLLRRASSLVPCSAATVTKSLANAAQRTLHFPFTFGPRNYVDGPASKYAP